METEKILAHRHGRPRLKKGGGGDQQRSSKKKGTANMGKERNLDRSKEPKKKRKERIQGRKERGSARPRETVTSWTLRA